MLRSATFKPKSIVKYLLTVLVFMGSTLLANGLPNKCSRDKNPNEFTILSYHEISEKSETLDSSYAVTPANFEAQVQWFIKNGYHFVNIDAILKYRKNGKPLPDKAVLMTFDDGYASIYHNAFPIIKKYKIPVVIALVGSWLAAKEKVDFDAHMIARDKFLNQSQLKEMVHSGFIEIASHTHSLHKGIAGNPQGNMQPAVRTRQWLPETQKYEDETSYQKRVYNDLLNNNTFLEKYTGQKPRIIVWPYGHYNIEVRKIAEKLGMPIGLNLDDGSNTRTTPLWGLRRILVEQKMTLKELELIMLVRNGNFIDDDRITKAAHIDLDYIYDADPDQQERNLGALLDRIKTLGINTIYLQAFADPDANGAADYVYFPNRNIPMRADLFNRVAWQITTRTQVKRIYAWMPMMAWQLPQNNPAVNDTIVTLQVDPTHLNMGYPRLSPFSPKAKKVIKEIYEDLSKSAYIDGLLFHDDVTLSDFEDDSSWARTHYKKWGLASNVIQIRANKKQFLRWTTLKTNYLDDFALELAQIVRNEQPGLKTARNLYAQVAINPDAQEWYAQSLGDSIKKYDYTAIMAMPYMEQADDAKAFYTQIVNNVKKEHCGVERVVMELQTVNWRKESEPLPKTEISQTISDLQDMGINHLAYYPDNVFKNVPDADAIREDFVQIPLRMHPYPPTQ